MRGPAVATDIVIKTGRGVVLVKRKNDPFRGKWAIPGGFVEYGEFVEQAAIREAREETGLDVELEKIVGVYSDPGRDPRGHVISVCFSAKQVGGSLRAGSDAADVEAFENIPWEDLAFDHAKILKDAGVR